VTRVLFVFVDGIGYGKPGPQNPFDGAPVRILAPLAGGAGARDVVYGAIDATLNHPGLPQSATGQTALFTGEDAVAIAGGHVSGYPTRALAAVLERRSFLRRARERGQRAAFVNAYDAARVAWLGRVARGEEQAPRHRRPSASTLAALAGGGELRTFDHDHAVTFDFTGEVCRAYGFAAPRRTIREAARTLAAAASELDVALFETFLTDKAGHAQDTATARLEVVRLERFLDELFAAIDPRDELVVVTSDHGNLEDLSTGSHTRNAVPLMAYGDGARQFVDGARSLLDVPSRCLVACAPAPNSLAPGSDP
jgi:hypothetical protein